MTDEAEAVRPELVIVRRRGGDDLAAAKGGAWKIAYADFVTAMMAFFLVMWLINASNEATRAQVASYFNPIKLTDSSTGERGLNDPKVTFKKKPGTESGPSTPAKDEPEAQGESELLENPEQTLDRVMSQAGSTQDAGYQVDASKNTPVAAADKPKNELVDPFDPKSWKSMGKSKEQGRQGKAPVESKPGEAARKDSLPPKLQDRLRPEIAAMGTNTQGSKKDLPGNVALPKAAVKIGARTAQDRQTRQDQARQADVDRQIEKAKQINSEIVMKLGKLPGSLPVSLDVIPTKDGILISLTDKYSFGMFETGSAEPQAQLVEFVATIAGVLANHGGYVVVRGHTDARPYRNKRYDNWQLSTARAHMAQYMLIRGGLDEARIRRVEGMADRELKNPREPNAPENRRIEILLGGVL